MSKLIFLKLPKQRFKKPITVYKAISITYYIARNVCGPFHTPPRPLEISRKNWRAKVKPFL
jgi:hypothetical protein